MHKFSKKDAGFDGQFFVARLHQKATEALEAGKDHFDVIEICFSLNYDLNNERHKRIHYTTYTLTVRYNA